MKMNKYPLRWLLAVVLIIAVVGLFFAGAQRLRMNADIMSSLPTSDPVLADSHYILSHHPIYDRVVVDIYQIERRPDILQEGAELVEARMRASGLFTEVGFQNIGRLIPSLMRHITDHLPILFSESDLQEAVEPLLKPDKIREILKAHAESLQDLSAIGQTQFIADDPLSLRYHVLSRLSSLSPTKGGHIQNGRLVSANGNHILVVAEPASSGMDTRYAMKINSLMMSISDELNRKYGSAHGFILTPVGAYRAALDNEISAKRNVHKAVLFSTVAIALLLLVAFPRPLIGLLALLPAFAGTMLAFFVYSLWHKSISLMAVGFGGAIISFTVDYGLAYLLFLDRPYETRGLEASRELWSLGLLAMLTTAVSFAFLSISGFAILMEIGLFAALGVVFTYIFVHAIFPLIFPVMPPARRSARLPLQRFINAIASADGMWKVYTALAFGIFMLFFARPDFHIELSSMNTLSKETEQADRLIRDVWGDILSKVYLMVEGRDGHEFQQKCDKLSVLLDQEKSAGRVSQYFVTSKVFPGEMTARRNAAAWNNFWNPERISDLRDNLNKSAPLFGFSPGAFDPFLKSLTSGPISGVEIPQEYAPLLGIKTSASGHKDSIWTQVVSVTPGPSYNGENFYWRITATKIAKVFDPEFFSRRLGSLLQSTFLIMAAIVGIITICTVFFYFLDWRLTLLGVAPTVFAIICTLGTLNLLGEPLGIPILIVSVVVIGMGTDYALYLIRAYQRYSDETPLSYPFSDQSLGQLGLIRLSVFLSFATTFLGFGVLAISDNALLKSAGIGLACGIGYSFMGAVMITPPLLKKIFTRPATTGGSVEAGSKQHFRKTLERYRHMESYPRLFARFKILLDPMFPRLAEYIRNPKCIIDIGSGYGVPAAWLLTLYPDARIHGIEPDYRRVRTAARAIGSQGRITVGAAPDLPEIPDKADTAIILDMIHMLNDADLRLTLQRLKEKLQSDGSVIIRATLTQPADIQPSKRILLKRWLEAIRIRIHKGTCYFRTEKELRRILHESGFEVMLVEPSAPAHEEFWFVARKRVN
jgi:predicted exporter/predicted O-methyltransferase YrrM